MDVPLVLALWAQAARRRAGMAQPPVHVRLLLFIMHLAIAFPSLSFVNDQQIARWLNVQRQAGGRAANLIVCGRLQCLGQMDVPLVDALLMQAARRRASMAPRPVDVRLAAPFMQFSSA